MSKPFNRKAEEALKKTIDEYEAVNASYTRVMRRYISSESFILGDEVCLPEVSLNANGLKEYEEAWLRVQETSKKIRRAFMKLYSAYQ